jgi:hypothetical protein
MFTGERTFYCAVPKAKMYIRNIFPPGNTDQYHVYMYVGYSSAIVGRPDKAPDAHQTKPGGPVQTHGSVHLGHKGGDVSLPY